MSIQFKYINGINFVENMGKIPVEVSSKNFVKNCNVRQSPLLPRCQS